MFGEGNFPLSAPVAAVFAAPGPLPIPAGAVDLPMDAAGPDAGGGPRHRRRAASLQVPAGTGGLPGTHHGAIRHLLWAFRPGQSGVRQPVLCIQRTLPGPGGALLEPQEIPLGELPGPPEALLGLLGLRLLLMPLTKALFLE